MADGSFVAGPWLGVSSPGRESIGLAGTGLAAADPLDSCPPGAMMRAQADQMNLLANFLAAHPDAGNSDSPADAVAALQMVAGLRNIQAGMAESCGITMSQLVPPGTNFDQVIPPGATVDQLVPPGTLPIIPPGR
jgi:hypothetical protein